MTATPGAAGDGDGDAGGGGDGDDGDGGGSLAPDDIGVITPYAAQVRALRDRLDRFGAGGGAGVDVDGGGTDATGQPGGVDVDSIDAFQGSERTAVVVSLVRSNPEGRIGFLGRPADGPRRLNVAVTRARRLCVLVGDWSTLRTVPPRGRAGGGEGGGEDTDGGGSDADDGGADDDAGHCADLYEDLYAHLVDTGRMREMDPDLLPRDGPS